MTILIEIPFVFASIFTLSLFVLQALFDSLKFSLEKEVSVGSVGNSQLVLINESVVSRLRKHALNLNYLFQYFVSTGCCWVGRR